MPDANIINEHRRVVHVDSAHVGIVDRARGNRIKPTGSTNDGEHHYVATALVQDIRGNMVSLTKSAADALRSAQAA